MTKKKVIVNDETPAPYFDRAAEDDIICKAIAILDRRLRGDDPVVVSSPGDVRNYLKVKLAGYEREVFGCLFMDNRHRVIAFEELFFGTIDSAAVHPREIVKRALALNAAALVMAHNHPSGVAEPSRADAALTGRVKDALALVDVRVLDHFVVGVGEVTSLAERGLL